MSPRRNTRPLASTGVCGDRRDAVERAGHPQRHALRRRLHDAGRHHRVLPRQRLEDLVRGDAERRELGIRELDEDLLVLGPVQVDLGDVLHLEQPLAERLGDLLHLRVVAALRRQHVEDRVDVAVLVVDRRADQAGRQIVLDVADLLAELVEQLRHVARRRVVLERHLHRGERRLGIGRHLVEIGQLLQLLLDRIGHLGLHVAGGRARPHRADDHDLDGEGRILGASEAAIGQQPPPGRRSRSGTASAPDGRPPRRRD